MARGNSCCYFKPNAVFFVKFLVRFLLTEYCGESLLQGLHAGILDGHSLLGQRLQAQTSDIEFSLYNIPLSKKSSSHFYLVLAVFCIDNFRKLFR